MRISKYGVALIRLTEIDLELVRNRRNSEEINKYMTFQEYITPEMQLKWFLTINNPENFYYVVEYKGDKIGLLNDKNIDWKEKTAEGGLFIWDERYINSEVPLMVSFLAHELAYYILGWKKTFITVRKDNLRAIEYNKAFGYQLLTEGETDLSVKMMLDKEHFLKKADKLRKFICSGSPDEKIIITFEKTDELNGTRVSVENIINAVPYDVYKDKVVIVYSQ
jgi:UDP-4-amino-4,6-dideoxy-N-acetyl-beta-L-altrosamine N-acetyltransferase